jgi:hypothetical protein
MKRCPVCQRTYPDDAQNFCLDDGATLLSENAPQQNPYGNRASPTQVMYPAPPTQGMVAPQTPLFASYTAPKRNALPLVIGVAGLVIVGIIVAIVLVLKGAGAATWQTFNGDKFSVNMPGTPVKSEQTQTTVAGPISIKMNTIDRGSEAYAVGYTEYPSVIFDSQSGDALLNGARDGAINNMHGQMLGERAISQGSYTGKEVTGKVPDKNYSFTLQLYLAKPRMYLLIFLKQGDQPISDDGRKFLDSFKITSS